jgi:hypothetical protein
MSPWSETLISPPCEASPESAIPDTAGSDAPTLYGAWSALEDSTLRTAVGRFGVKDGWMVIARTVGTRTAKQCRERWFR